MAARDYALAMTGCEHAVSRHLLAKRDFLYKSPSMKTLIALFALFAGPLALAHGCFSQHLHEAMRVVHAAFGLDADDLAAVHGGTGR